MTYDAKEVRALLAPSQILEHHEIAYSEHRGQLVTRHCPGCGERSRPSVYIDASSGAWKCHAHGCRGDLYALVAGYGGIELRRGTFARVVALAAQIAGVDGDLSPAERERLVAERHRREAERAERKRARDAAARARMPAAWLALARRHATGENYLRDQRGLPPAPFYRRDLARYTSCGEPAVVLRDLATGAIVGLQYRRLVEDEPRQLVLGGSQVRGAALVGRVGDLRADGVVVICEGLIDALTACLAWPDAAIFGAPGADQLGAIAAALAPRIAELRGVLLVVGDDDQAGRDGSARAIAAAECAGLVRATSDAPRIPATVRAIDLGVGLDDRRHHDLNDAWRRSAWRWGWPNAQS